MEGEKKPVVVCPRCGQLASGLISKRIGKNVYTYAVHREGGKRHYCYLGADRYIYVTSVHPVELRGLNVEGDYWRILQYIKELLDAVERSIPAIKDEHREAVRRELMEIQQKALKLWVSMS